MSPPPPVGVTDGIPRHLGWRGAMLELRQRGVQFAAVCCAAARAIS